MGVTSSMRPILRPARASARSADWAPGPGVFVFVAARGADLDVQRRHAELLAAHGDVLGGKHGRVGRRLVAVGLDLSCRP